MQYGVWLKGEPGRRVGNDQGRSEGTNKMSFKQNREETTAGMVVQEAVRQEVREKVGEGHVSGSRTNQRSSQIYRSEEKRLACEDEEFNHEHGKSSLPQEKGDEGLDIRSMNSLTGNLPTVEIEGDMQWEKTKSKVEDSKLKEKERHTDAGSELGLETI